MKDSACIALILCLTVSLSIIVTPATAIQEPIVGVKEGDWIEYNIAISGTGTPPPTHDVRWMRLQVLSVEDTAFSVNVTARYANGTVGSAVWPFNFTEGNVGGWIIIPAGLNAGDSFFDFSIHNHKPANITIQSQEQKAVLGAVRTVTYGNDSFRHKQWDQASGVFVGSSETYRNVTNKDGWYIDNLTVTIEATATNIWSPEATVATSQSLFYSLVTAVVAAAAILSLLILAARRKHVTLSIKQKQIIEVLLVLGLVLAVAAITSTPISESQVPLSFRDINMIMQTLWLMLLLAGMWFRRKGNYFLHGILTILVVSITVVGFLGVLVMSPMSNNSMDEYLDSPVDLAIFFGHAVFSFPALAFGVWVVLLWRPNSAAFPAKSRKIAYLMTVFWVLSYVVGVLDFVLLRNNYF